MILTVFHRFCHSQSPPSTPDPVRSLISQPCPPLLVVSLVLPPVPPFLHMLFFLPLSFNVPFSFLFLLQFWVWLSFSFLDYLSFSFSSLIFTKGSSLSSSLICSWCIPLDSLLFSIFISHCFHTCAILWHPKPIGDIPQSQQSDTFHCRRWPEIVLYNLFSNRVVQLSTNSRFRFNST